MGPVPCGIILSSPGAQSVEPAAWEVRGAVFLVTCYLISTFARSLDRIYGMALLSHALPGWGWAHSLGVAALSLGVAGASTAALVLCGQSARIQDVLLNCLALSFIVDADASLVAGVRWSGAFGCAR